MGVDLAIVLDRWVVTLAMWVVLGSALAFTAIYLVWEWRQGRHQSKEDTH